MHQFKTGCSYVASSGRFIVVKSRTKKNITTNLGQILKIYTSSDSEIVYPQGQHRNAIIVSAAPTA
jgi:hypothetical protein